MAAIIDYRGKTPEKTAFGVPLVTAKVVKSGRIETPDEFIAEEDYEAWMRRGIPQRGDIVMTTEAPLGEVAQLDGTKIALAQRVITLRGKPDILDNTFMKFLMQSSAFQEGLKARATGTTVLGIRQSELRKVDLTFPPLPTQRAIASILGTLDDLIELNRETNEILEEMVRALFKSWFVDFDPVRAKLEGRPPAGMDAETAALFPDHFGDSELGQIPRGWEISTIGEKLKTALGGTPSRARAEFWVNGTVPWINSGKTNDFRIIEPSEWITAEALGKSATKLLPRRTTVLAITGATLGQVSIAEIECCANQSVVAILASDEFPTEFIYPWIKENIEKLIASRTGGAQQHINKGNVQELSLLCPDERVVSAFTDLVRPMFDTIHSNLEESRDLAALRDTLLPKLLSGEVSVPEAVQLAAPAT